MRLPEKCFEWQAGAWTFGITLCPGTWAVIVFWDGNPYGLAVALPLVRFWCERDGGRYCGRGSGPFCASSSVSRSSGSICAELCKFGHRCRSGGNR